MTTAAKTTTKTTFGNNGHRLEPQPLQGWEPDTLIRQPADDSGNAQCLHYLYGNQFRFCEAYGWVFYNGQFWDRTNAEALVKRAAVDMLIERRTQAVKHDREAIVRATRASAHNVRSCLYLFAPLVTIDVSEFDKSPDLLNCQNGMVDLRTGKVAPHDPGQFFTYAIPVDYDPTADMQGWIEFLLDVTDNKQEIVDYLQTAIGYSLTGHTWEEILFYIHGPTRSGKGTFTETLLAMMGKEPLATEVDFVTFTAQRDHDTQNFDLAPLKPCRLIVASESSKYQLFNTAKIKQLTAAMRCDVLSSTKPTSAIGHSLRYGFAQTSLSTLIPMMMQYGTEFALLSFQTRMPAVRTNASRHACANRTTCAAFCGGPSRARASGMRLRQKACRRQQRCRAQPIAPAARATC